MDALRHKVHAAYKNAAEAVLPTLQTSAFQEKGVLTPDEFVEAGDYLVQACPTWAWAAGESKKARSYLPPDKQFLLTKNVPCLRRAKDVEKYGSSAEVEIEPDERGDGWLAAGVEDEPVSRENEDGFEDISEGLRAGGGGGAAGGRGGGETASGGSSAASSTSSSDVPDLDDLELSESDSDDEAVADPTVAGGAGAVGGGEEGDGRDTEGGGRASGRPRAGPSSETVRTRTYDLLITYDKYYQVPRLWLLGYDEHRRPLPPSAILDDVSEDHARKTVTVEPHPHGNDAVLAASIHPCRHANVLKRLSRVVSRDGRPFEVRHALVLFLKFIAGVVPTIDYDYTMATGAE